MIYRILTDAVALVPDPDSNGFVWRPSATRMCGAFTSGAHMPAMDVLGYPSLANPRAVFWFTEAGWDAVGRKACADLRAAGHTVRVLKHKEPAKSRVAYRDRFQVALLPDSTRRSQGRARSSRSRRGVPPTSESTGELL